VLLVAFCAAALASVVAVRGQEVGADSYSGLRWRFLGTYRGGRITAVAGSVSQPNTYYVGTPNGGVWKTVDGGRTWKPVFDSIHVASIGALVVAPSNPNILYAGTGEQGRGQGVFKSTDAGKSWQSAGLQDAHFIHSLVVDPRNPDVVVAGAWGSWNPKEPRGIFKTTDGGKTWSKSLEGPDGNSGIADITAAADDPRLFYAALNPPPGEPSDKSAPPESRIFFSSDAGSTWKETGASGLPAKGRGRIGVAVVPGTFGRGVLAILNQGLFRSDDGGATWKQSTKDPRILGSGYFSKVYVDPNNPDVVYVMQTCTYRSNDGGKTFFAWRGAPSGEDHHVLWIAPDHSNRILLGTDQGAIISVNGGETWTDWLNQPTGQLYHVSTDSTFPYHAYAAQQDSGTIVVPSRSDYGWITYRDWYSSGGFESGYIAADPLNSNLVYSIGWFGTVFRLDRVTGQLATVYVPPANFQTVWETPLVYDPRDPHTLYYASQFLLKTTDGAKTWSVVSPDLSSSPQHPAEVKKPGNGHQPDPDDEDLFADANDKDAAQFSRNGAIHTIAPSPVESGMIWVGTSNGLIQLFRNGNWTDVTPADFPARADVRLVEPSPFDANAAYAVLTPRRDDHPYIYRTRDAGKTWTKIVNGLPDDVPAAALREDGKRRGLLFAGTQLDAYVSFDDGDHWQTLQLNLPATPVMDFSVHGDDLVAATFGRGLWVIDDISPLRELNAKLAAQNVHFFTPQAAVRVRWDNHEETPLSPEYPASDNPPDGASLYYWLKVAPKNEMTLDVKDGHGKLVRHYSSRPPAPATIAGNAPDYWFAAPAALDSTAGLHRFVWDLRTEDPLTLTYGYFGGKLDYIEYTLPDHSIPGNTPRQQPPGALVPPASYELILTVDGKQFRQKLNVTLDPRVHVGSGDLEDQWKLAGGIADAMAASYNGYNDYAKLAAAIDDRLQKLKDNSSAKDLAEALTKLRAAAAAVGEGKDDAPGIGPMNRDISRYFVMVESADLRPVESAHAAAKVACQKIQQGITTWQKLNAEDIPALNKLLLAAHLELLPVANGARNALVCSD
jgi:photosystem II stability/assembly factor-like uncharacterized protein